VLTDLFRGWSMENINGRGPIDGFHPKIENRRSKDNTPILKSPTVTFCLAQLPIKSGSLRLW